MFSESEVPFPKAEQEAPLQAVLVWNDSMLNTHARWAQLYLVVVLQAWRGDHLALLRLDQPVQELFSSHL